jgi:hypothetical protein
MPGRERRRKGLNFVQAARPQRGSRPGKAHPGGHQCGTPPARENNAKDEL